MELDIYDAKRIDENTIDVTWNHPELSPRLGPLPYTCVNNSGEELMQAIWDGLMRGDYGPIADVGN